MIVVSNRARQLGTLAVTCIGFFMVLLDASIVTVALPTIQRVLHTQLSGLQWVVDAYTLPFAVLLLTAGTLGDRFGRKRIFLFGLVIFTVGSGMCGLAPSLPWLIAGRAFQGVGSAALTPGSLSLLAAAFTVPRERTQALGIWSGISGVALAAGPLLGGLLIQVSGWQAIFFVNLPIGAIAFALGALVLSESRNPAATRLDVPGQLLAIGGLSALVYALIEGQAYGWSSPLIVSLLAAAATLLTLFLIVEARSSDPVLPLGLFKSAVFSTANFAALAVGFGLLGTVFFISQFFQEVQGYTPLQSGTRTLPITIGIFIVAPLAGRITARFGPRLPIALGALLAGVALLLLTRLEPDTAYGSLWWNYAFFGVGIGLTLSPITAAVLASVPTQRAGLASGVVTTSRQIGSVLGIALLGALVQNQEARNLASGLGTLHLPEALSNRLAGMIAVAGAGIHQLQFAGHLPISTSELFYLASQSFAEALHPGFVITAVAFFLVSGLAFAFLGRGGLITTLGAPANVLAVESPATRTTEAMTSTAAVPVELP
jgi:DHA2 family methylenomycin A resistance protein-like MFS transporter